MSHWSESGKQGIEILECHSNRASMFKILPSKEEVVFYGISYCGKITIFKRQEGKIIFKVRGGSSWSAVGESTYYRPRYLIGLDTAEGFIEKWQVDYGQSSTKEGKAKALELFDSLKGGKP